MNKNKKGGILITYAQPIGNGIKRDIYVIDQLAKGKLKLKGWKE